MQILSLSFLLAFLPGAVCLAMVITARRNEAGNSVLVKGILSVAFYLLCSPRDFPVLGGSIVANWLAISWRESLPPRWRNTVTGMMIAANLAVLAVFKYLHQTDPGQTLPLGISYYTFTQIAFLVDHARGQVPSVRFRDFAVFSLWFPHLSAGPLLSPRQMLPQLAAPAPAPHQRGDDLASGLTLLAAGLFKNIVLSPLFLSPQGTVFERAAAGQSPGMAETWIACLARLLQLYLDFSGYSEIAMGISRLFGINLPVNFHAPLRASSLVEFWARWHITLGKFMRDYVYAPLTRRREPWRHYGALFVVMIAVAVWHKATLPMILFGVLHGCLLVITHMARQRKWIGRQRGTILQQTVRRHAGRIMTVGLVTFSIGLWEAGDMSQSSRLLGALCGFGAGQGEPIHSYHILMLAASLLIAWTLPDVIDLMSGTAGTAAAASLVRCPPALAWRMSTGWATVTATVLFLALLFISRAGGFHYAGY